MNVVHGQYEEAAYPLARYPVGNIPAEVRDSMLRLLADERMQIRGGLAYILLSGDEQYMLKDLDMLSTDDDEQAVICHISDAEVVYVNRNSRGEKVVTAFWKGESGYFKLDVLMGHAPVAAEACLWNNVRCRTITRSYLVTNRICKIAEKERRRHSDAKTLNHYKVAQAVAQDMLARGQRISSGDRPLFVAKVEDASVVLRGLIGRDDAERFARTCRSLAD